MKRRTLPACRPTWSTGATCRGQVASTRGCTPRCTPDPCRCHSGPASGLRSRREVPRGPPGATLEPHSPPAVWDTTPHLLAPTAVCNNQQRHFAIVPPIFHGTLRWGSFERAGQLQPIRIKWCCCRS